MDLIKMNNIAERMRECIWSFSLICERQNFDKYDELLCIMHELYRVGMSDKMYWDNTEVDFQFLYNQIETIEAAIKMDDFVSIYDRLNFEVRWFVKSVFEVLFKKNALEIKKWYWDENREALKKRYPKVLELLEEIDDGKEEQNVRDYGLRGNVIYRKDGNFEYDLYSAYNPSEVGTRTLQRSEFKKYANIYVWGFNGGLEISGDTFFYGGKKKHIEIYVTNLLEFKQILLNTMRKGLLLNLNINWNFNSGLVNFFNDIDLLKKNDSYIYVTECLGKDLIALKEFINKNSINSNIG